MPEEDVGKALLKVAGGGVLGAFAGLFGAGDDAEERAKKLRADQRKFYDEAIAGTRRHFRDVLTTFDNRLGSYREEMEARYPDRRDEIASIFSMQNPAIANYVKNLEKGFQQSEKRVYGQVRKANIDELRSWAQKGITGGTIGRMIAGNQMQRVEQAENILTQKLNQVLAPQAGIAQQQMGALGLMAKQQEAERLRAGMLEVQTPVQLGMKQAGIEAGLAGQFLSEIGTGGRKALPPPKAQVGLPEMLTTAGGKVAQAGFEQLF